MTKKKTNLFLCLIRKNTKGIIQAFFLIIFFSTLSFAQENTSTVKIEDESVEKKDKKEIYESEKKDKKGKKISLSLDYAGSIDINENKSPKTINHQFEISAAKSFKKLYFASLSLSAGYFSIGKKIPTENNYELKELAFLFGKNFKSFNIFKFPSSFKISGGNLFFLDDYSKYEGYISMPLLSFSLSMVLTKKLRFMNSLSSGYLINRYDYSPSSHRSNQIFWSSFTPSLVYNPLKGLFVSTLIGLKASRRIDGVMTRSFMNSIGVSYKIKDLNFGLKWINGSYEDSSFDLLYIDKYRQIVSFSIGYAF